MWSEVYTASLRYFGPCSVSALRRPPTLSLGNQAMQRRTTLNTAIHRDGQSHHTLTVQGMFSPCVRICNLLPGEVR